MALDFKGVEKILKECKELLCNKLEPTNILSKMKIKDALTDDEVTRIKREDSRQDKVYKLLEELKLKPVTSYNVFMELLKEERSDLYNMMKDKEAKHIGKPFKKYESIIKE